MAIICELQGVTPSERFERLSRQGWLKRQFNRTVISGATNHYHLKKIRDGAGDTILTVDGYTSQNVKRFNDWDELLAQCYPDAARYHLSWQSASELQALDNLRYAVHLGRGVWSLAARRMVGGLPAWALQGVVDVGTSTWLVAKRRAGITGELLAEQIAASDIENFTLMGHSLGGRVILYCLETLDDLNQLDRIRQVHLLGAAAPAAEQRWGPLAGQRPGMIHNYYSRKDAVLKYLYNLASHPRHPAVGRTQLNVPGIVNHDVSALVRGHMGYKSTTIGTLINN